MDLGKGESRGEEWEKEGLTPSFYGLGGGGIIPIFSDLVVGEGRREGGVENLPFFDLGRGDNHPFFGLGVRVRGE